MELGLWTEQYVAISQVFLWSMTLVGVVYSKMRLKRNDWAIALLIALLFLSIGVMDFFLQELTNVGLGA